MSDERRRIVVTLRVRDDKDVDSEWSLVLRDADESVLEAVDTAIKQCDHEVRGLDSVETFQLEAHGESNAGRD